MTSSSAGVARQACQNRWRKPLEAMNTTRRIDSRMRQVFPDSFEDAELEVEKPKRQANVVAPATRSAAPKKVTLTQTQVSIAKRLGVPSEQYAQTGCRRNEETTNG